jgi:cytidylate kinase
MNITPTNAATGTFSMRLEANKMKHNSEIAATIPEIRARAPELTLMILWPIIATIQLKTVQDDMSVRDDRDRTRTVDPLRPAPEAIMIDTSRQSVEDVVGHMMKIIADRL